jgi:CRISPR-associated endonuclease Cas1
MRHHSTIVSPSSAIRNGVLVLSGYGLRVTVERGHLVCADGYCDVRRRLRLHRATCGLRRLVLLGVSGFVTLEALRWLHGIGAAVVQVADHGEVIVASGPQRLDDARLRRAQALALPREVGLRSTRELLRAKLTGQAGVLDRLGAAHAASALRGATDTLDRAHTLDRLQMVEADAASAYWDQWRSVLVPFARRDERFVPDHWRTVGPRSSPLTGQPRLAASPAHAILNYLYAVLETEARIACRTVGLDPGMGILHADQPARDSLALDLMEPVRPKVDAFLLDLLRERVFSRDDFEETRRGVCRVLPPLTHHLAETGPRWAQDVAPWAERVASLLMADSSCRRERPVRVPTPLTQANRSAGRDATRRRPLRVRVNHVTTMPHACRECGVLLDSDRRRLYCDDCLPALREETNATILRAGADTLRRLREAGRDPAHGGAAAEARRNMLKRRKAETHAWERNHVRPNPETFTRDILPSLRRISIRPIAKVTGLGASYCSMIRRGTHVPHPRHWEALRDLAK